MNYSFLQCGEGALTVHLGDGINPAINRREPLAAPACVGLQT